MITGRLFDKIYCNIPPEDVLDPFLAELIFDIKVFARMKPNQKYRVIEVMQEQKRVVAMVGDGANDCMALKQAGTE